MLPHSWWVALDVWVAVVLLGAPDPRFTLSAWAFDAAMRGYWMGEVARRCIDAVWVVLYGVSDHCRVDYEKRIVVLHRS